MLKAFDSLDHNYLLTKLRRFGLMQSAVSWFSSYLSFREQRVRFEDSISEILPMEHGVPQGSILVPILLIIYVDDLINEISDKIIGNNILILVVIVFQENDLRD